MMSDKLYTDRVGSVVREVCSNAWDAQKMRSIATGQPMEPFKVTLPTDFEPHFIVEDSGPGMPDDVAQDLYSTLGLSTKENTNDQIGAFGLGSKSPFAVTDTFTVENTYDGVTYHYLCFKSESGLPSLLKTGETKDGRSNGVKVMIPAAGSKYAEYKRALGRQLIVMEPKPIIANIESFEFPEANKALETPEGFILANAADFAIQSPAVFARMGMVLYPVEIGQLNLDYKDRFHDKFKGGQSLVLEFPIGALEPLPSREGLTYDDRTINNIRESYLKFAESYMQLLRKQVEEQPNPLEAWRKMQDIRVTMNIDMSRLKDNIYNLGFVIDYDYFSNSFPYFDHHYKNRVLRVNSSPPQYDDEGRSIVKPPEYDEVDNIKSVSRYYYELFRNDDLRLNIKREPYEMRMDFRTLSEIEKGNIKILIMDELEPKYRIGRMKSALKSLISSSNRWGTQVWVIRVDARYPGAKDNFDEFVRCFEMLHRGITKNFVWFSSVPKPENERRKREDDAVIDGVAIKRSNSKWEDHVRWSTIDDLMEPKGVTEEDDDYEELREKAKAAFVKKHFYILANRNELVDYPHIEIKTIFAIAKEQERDVFIVRKTGMNKLKELQEYGLKEFKEHINDILDGYEVSDDFKKYSSAKKVVHQFPLWFRHQVKMFMQSAHNYLVEMKEFVHPFIKEYESVNRLSSLDYAVSQSNIETKLINLLRTTNLIRFFDGYDWAKLSEIDITEDFKKQEASFIKYYPAFLTLARYLDLTSGQPILYEYMRDYNALRGADVVLEDFEEVEQQTVEVKETEDEDV
jgi:hypothetical protein